jgi:hypothetical protein
MAGQKSLQIWAPAQAPKILRRYLIEEGGSFFSPVLLHPEEGDQQQEHT